MKPVKKWLIRLLAILFWIVVWAVASAGIGNTLLFPSPLTVWNTLLGLLKTSLFYRITFHSVWNVFSGILMAVISGCILSALSHRILLFRELFLPVMTVIKATPVASFIVLTLIWIGSAKVPTLITFLIVLPVVWTNLDEGLNRQDRQLAEVAKVYNFSLFKQFRLLTVPSVMPYFVSAIRTSLGLAWKAGIAAEIIAMPRDSIGTMIGNAKQYLNTEEMFAWTLTVILLSLLFEYGFLAILNLLTRKYSGGKESQTC